MDGTVRLQPESSASQFDGAVCLMNPKNKEQGRRRVELKAALKVGLLFCSFVCLWAPLPIYVLVMRETVSLREKLQGGPAGHLLCSWPRARQLLTQSSTDFLNRQIRSAAWKCMDVGGGEGGMVDVGAGWLEWWMLGRGGWNGVDAGARVNGGCWGVGMVDVGGGWNGGCWGEVEWWMLGRGGMVDIGGGVEWWMLGKVEWWMLGEGGMVDVGGGWMLGEGGMVDVREGGMVDVGARWNGGYWGMVDVGGGWMLGRVEWWMLGRGGMVEVK
ncbi:hypothetical protein Btru_020264 [Bulinus truncatus]|nr:hypothetical protein Btru_020264 [Bulinus truncatus]